MSTGLQVFNASGIEILGPADGIGRVTGYTDLAGASGDPITPNSGSLVIPGFITGDRVWYVPNPEGGGEVPGGNTFNLNTYSLSGDTISYVLHTAIRLYYGLY